MRIKGYLITCIFIVMVMGGLIVTLQTAKAEKENVIESKLDNWH